MRSRRLSKAGTSAGRLSVVVLAGLLLPACGGPDLGVDRVVVISLDTLRVDHLGAYNPDVETTPHLDAIAAEGVRFENAYAPVPLTLPSHTSLFTGRSPLQTGVMANGDQVPEDIPALAEIFRDHGFATGAFVSLGVLNDNFGLARGFDAYNLDLGDTGRWYRSADEVFEPAWAWVEEHRDDPFLLWVHYSDAHEPYASKTFPPDLAVELDGEVLGEYRLSLKENLDVAFELPPGRHTLSFRSLIPEPTRRERGLWLEVRNATEVQPWLFESEGLPAGEVPIHPALDLELLNSGADPVAVTVAFKGRWKHPPPGVVRREYALEVAYVDRYVGELRNRMAAAGLDERTLWLVVSDHGEGLYRHNALGHAAAVWEDQLRIAWFMSGPGLPAGEVYSGLPARMEDVAPTLLGHLGMKVPKGVDGIDLHGCWSGEGCPRIPPRWSFGINDKGVLTGVAGYDWPYKWMWFRGRDRVFGLDIDPWESRRGTIAHDAPADVLSLGRQAERYRQVVTEGLERRSRREPTPEEIEMLRNLGYL